VLAVWTDVPAARVRDPAVRDNCAGGFDDDGDGRPDCPTRIARCTSLPEGVLCADHVDNDDDGATDCADRNCNGAVCAAGRVCAWTNPTTFAAARRPATTNLDNDGDRRDRLRGSALQRTACAVGAVCAMSSCAERNCGDGLDNDNDNLADCTERPGLPGRTSMPGNGVCSGPNASSSAAGRCGRQRRRQDRLRRRAVQRDRRGCGANGSGNDRALRPARVQGGLLLDHLDNNRDGLTDCDDPNCNLGICGEIGSACVSKHCTETACAGASTTITTT